jgi:hypothetical protein
MSPEQAAGRLDELGPTADVYSLGATLYHLLTGKVAFAGNDAAEVLRKVHAGDFAPPRQVQPAVPLALAAVCCKAMALRPAERYATARELAEEIERWLADEPVLVWPEPLRMKARRWVSRHRPLVSGVAIGLLVAIIALVAWDVKQSQDTLRTINRHRDGYDLQTAVLLGDLMRGHLDDIESKLINLANNNRLRTPLNRFLLDRSPKNRKELEDYLRRVGRYERLFAIIEVCDNQGILVAGWQRTESRDNTLVEAYGQRLCYRDCWTHKGDDDRAKDQTCPYVHYRDQDGREIPYISRPCTSENGMRRKIISVSMPLYVDDEKDHHEDIAGLLVISIDLADLRLLLRALDEGVLRNARVVVLDRSGYCIYREGECPALREGRASPDPEKTTCALYEGVLSGARGIADYVDPYDGKTYAAGYAPIMPFGWGVILQHEEESYLQEVRGKATTLVWVVITLSLTLLTLLGWLALPARRNSPARAPSRPQAR